MMKEFDQLYFDELCRILESYLDQNDEAARFIKFFDYNFQVLCASQKLGRQCGETVFKHDWL